MNLLSVKGAVEHFELRQDAITTALPSHKSFLRLKALVEKGRVIVFSSDDDRSTFAVTMLPAGELAIEVLVSSCPGWLWRNARMVLTLARMAGAHSITCDHPATERLRRVYRRFGAVDTPTGMARLMESNGQK